MKIGDLILFYHSNTKIPGIAGLAKVNIVLIKVVKEGYPDSTAFDPNHPYFDAKSDPNNPKWFMVDVQFIKKFDNLISLNQLKSYPELKNMKLLNRGRLSVQPVTKQEFDFISSL
jgi:predicted RNA-binding protein with PUA-like domain